MMFRRSVFQPEATNNAFESLQTCTVEQSTFTARQSFVQSRLWLHNSLYFNKRGSEISGRFLQPNEYLGINLYAQESSKAICSNDHHPLLSSRLRQASVQLPISGPSAKLIEGTSPSPSLSHSECKRDRCPWCSCSPPLLRPQSFRRLLQVQRRRHTGWSL